MTTRALIRAAAKCGIGSTVLLLAPGTAQATPGRTYLPFQPGVVSECDQFAVSVAPVVDKQYETVHSLADGTLAIRVTGDLVLRFTNLTDSAKSIVRDSPGPYTVTINPDGSGTFTSIGLGINGFDPGVAAAFGVPPIAQTAGRLQITFTLTGSVTSLSVHGRVTDICAELA